jgi:hypothetical protein
MSSLRKCLSIVMQSRYRISQTLATPSQEGPVRKVFRKSRSAHRSKRGYLGKEGRRRLIFVTHIRIDPIKYGSPVPETPRLHLIAAGSVAMGFLICDTCRKCLRESTYTSGTKLGYYTSSLSIVGINHVVCSILWLFRIVIIHVVKLTCPRQLLYP